MYIIMTSIIMWCHIPASSSFCLTVLQRGGSHLCRRGPCPSAVTGLYHDSILGELLKVVQHQAFCIISCGLHTDHTELVVSTRAVLPVAHLVAPDGSVLQVPLGRLAKEWQRVLENVPLCEYITTFYICLPWRRVSIYSLKRGCRKLQNFKSILIFSYSTKLRENVQQPRFSISAQRGAKSSCEGFI